MTYLLDADWVIQALAGRPPAVTTLRHLAGSTIAVSWVTVGEIYEGAFRSANPRAHLAAFDRFLLPYHLLGLSRGVMERFAELRAFLRHRGELIPDFDIVVGATALHYDLTVLTFNRRHLQRIPDLRLYQPSEPPV